MKTKEKAVKDEVTKKAVEAILNPSKDLPELPAGSTRVSESRKKE